MWTIRLKRMEFFAYHGCSDAEQDLGNRFEVDVQLKGDFSAAAESDKLSDALDYQQAYKVVKEEMQQPSRLLEHVCGRIATGLYAKLPDLQGVEIRVSKKNPPMGGLMDDVSVFYSDF